MILLKIEIKNKLDEIENVRSKPNPHSLEPLCRDLLGVIIKLRESITDQASKDELQIVANELLHTINKEVQYVSAAYSATRKKNAAQVRQTEYEQSLADAISQIHLDLPKHLYL